MNVYKQALLSVALITTAATGLACDYPSRPNDLPDGATASKDQMMVGVKAINDYQASMSEYLACIEAEEVVAAKAMEDADEESLRQRKEMFNKKYNAAVEAQTLTVEEFNAEIRAYKAQSN